MRVNSRYELKIKNTQFFFFKLSHKQNKQIKYFIWKNNIAGIINLLHKFFSIVI